MSYNIGPKIGIDGEKEFRDSIKKINDTYKALEAETRAVTAAFDAQGDEQGKLEATSKQLQKQIDNQKSKMSLLEDAVKKASDKFGENSIEATRLRGALYDTQATVSKLENELKDTSSQLDSAGDAMEEFADASEDASEAALTFGDVLTADMVSDVALDLLDSAIDAVKEFVTESIDASAEMKAASSQFKQTFGSLKDEAESSLEGIADSAGVTATRLQESYTKTFAFTKSIGADSDQAMDIANRAMLAAADSAAYYDKTIEEATETLQSFLKGNYENDAALGIAATETARNAKANELYAKSFQELSETQKVDVLLSMVEAGNQASGALGQAAREADSWTNVTGEASEAVHQLQAAVGEPYIEALIPVVKSVTEVIREMVEVTDGQRIADNLKEIQDAWADTEDHFDDVSKEIQVSSDMVHRYVDRLFALEDAGLASTEAQKEHANVIAILNELMPELNLYIDEQTGLVDKSRDSILAEIDALNKKALTQAASEKYSSILRTQADAALTVGEAERRLVEISEERAAIEETLTGLAGHLSGLDRKKKEQLAELEIEEKTLNKTIEEGNQIAAEAAEEAANLRETYEGLAQASDSSSAAQDGLAEATGKVAAAQEDQQEKLQSATDALGTIRQAYADAKTESLDSINAQIGLFDELAASSDYSASNILENWKKQQQAFADYRENLQKAVDMGLDQALVQQLSDGSQQSMQILNALVNDTEISIGEINAAFSNVSESKDNLETVLTQIKLMTDEEFAALVESAKESGVNWVDGLIAGVESRTPAFRAAAAGVGYEGLLGFNKEMAINSPARKMIPSGEYTVDGAIVGVENRAKAFEETMSDLALAGENAYLSAQLDRVGAYPSVVQAPASSSRTVSHNYGGINIEIHQRPGESGEDLAYRIMEIMQQEVEAKEAGIGA